MEEIELTFLPKSLPAGVLTSSSKVMLDIYLPASIDHPHLRIRHSGDKYEITKKVPVQEGDKSHHIENTIPLTVEEFADLNQLPGKRVEKTRYLYEEGGNKYEVDVFKGDLTGLVLVDIEFNSLADKAKFQMPDWCLVEVTQEEFIAGGMLCGKSYQDIEEQLKRFSYSKLSVG